MKRKNALILLLILSVTAAAIFGISTLINNKSADNITTDTSADPDCKLTKITPVFDTSKKSFINRMPFVLSDAMSGNNGKYNALIFRGTIEKICAYDASWKSDDGKSFGPYEKAIMEVKVSKVYKGNAKAGNTVKVLYGYFQTILYEDIVNIKEGGEYVFSNCWSLDEKYADVIKNSETHSGSRNDPSLKIADAIIGGAWCSIMPVDNGIVYLYHEYFDGDEEIMTKALSPESAVTDCLLNDGTLTYGDFIALKLTDFEPAFEALAKKYQ